MVGLKRGGMCSRAGPLVEGALVPNRPTLFRERPVGVHLRSPGKRHTQDDREKVTCAVVAQDDASPAGVFPQLRHSFGEVLPCRNVGLRCHSRAAISLKTNSNSPVRHGAGVHEEVCVEGLVKPRAAELCDMIA